MKLRLLAAGLASAALLSAARAEPPRPCPTVASCQASAVEATDDTPQVAVELRLVAVSENFVKGHGRELGLDGKGPRHLSDARVRRLAEALQADPHTSVLQAPKVSVFDGQTAHVQIGQEQVFDTGTVELGLDTVLTAKVADDRRHVTLDVELSQTSLEGEEDLQVLVSPDDEEGNSADKDAAAPGRTLALRTPILSHQQKRVRVRLKDGHTALTPAWTETHTEEGPKVPLLGDLPYLGRLFQGQPVRQTYQVYLLATPRVLGADTP